MPGSNLKFGDEVRLKSGGQVMTVVYVDASRNKTTATCQWTDGSTVIRKKFDADTLEPAEPDA